MEGFAVRRFPPRDLHHTLAVAEEASARFGWPLHVIENCNDDPPVEQPVRCCGRCVLRSMAPDCRNEQEP